MLARPAECRSAVRKAHLSLVNGGAAVMKRRRWGGCVIAGLMAVMLMAVTGRGQEPAPPPATAGSAEQQPLREQTIYIPYQKLRGIFEADGRGVFLPYEQFQQLWEQARAAEEQQPDAQPPVGAIITDIVSEAVVEKDVVRVTAEVSIELLSKGWHEIPLRLADAAIRSATIDGEPARVVSGDAGTMLVVEQEDNEPRSLLLTVEYSKAYTKAPGQNSVSFQPPRAAVNRWRIRVPQSGVTVNVQPMLAAAEAPADASGEAPVDETVVLAFVGAAAEVRIDWTPKAEGASGLAALATVQSQQEVTIDEGLVRSRSQLTYAVSRAELAQLVIDVPESLKITRVTDPNIRQWDVAAVDGNQRITAELFEPVRGSQQVTIELEELLDDAPQTQVRVAAIEAVGVSRQQGVVVVRLADELRGEASLTEGLLQLDASELPVPLQATPWDFAYRYASVPFTLAVDVEAVQPRIEVRQLVEAYVEPNQLALDVATIFGIENAGVFQLELDIPEAYDVRRVQGRQLGDSAPVQVDTFHLADAAADGMRRLSVNLASKAIGRVGLVVTLIRPLAEPALLSPTGETVEIAMPLPTVATPLQSLSGRLVVLGPESLQITPAEREKLRDISVAEARQEVPTVRDGRSPGLREVMAFAYAREAASLRVSAERRRPQVNVRQLLAMRIEPGVVKYAATFTYDIAYSPVTALRVDLPAEVVPRVRIPVNVGINKTVLDPQPDEVAEGQVAVELTGETEFLGTVVVPMSWEEVVPELDVGESGETVLPVLVPRAADRAWGQVVVSKAETLDIRPAAGMNGLRPIDPQHDLMPGANVTDVARAFEFTDSWNLTVTATRYELEEVKRASIERAVVRMVVTRGDEITVQAVYRIRSVLQRLAVTLPAESRFDMDMLTVNGQPQPLERGEGNQLFIPLVNQSPDVPCIVEMRYTTPGTYNQLDLPVFPAQEGLHTAPALQKVALTVYLPEETAVIDTEGAWTNEQADWYAQLNRLPWRQQDDSELFDWVCEGVPFDQGRLRSFATDGTAYRFTALRPAPPPEGSLVIRGIDRRLVDGGGIAILALLALAFARCRIGTKLTLLVIIALGLVGLGICLPTLAMQVIDQNLAIGLASVGVVWLVGSATRRRRPKQSAAMPTASPTPAPSTGLTVDTAPLEIEADGGDADA